MEKNDDPSGLFSSLSFSNSFSNSRWRLVRFTGVSTASSITMSPVFDDRSAGIPFARSRICLPDCAPAGTLTRALPPSIVGTSISPPIAAVGIDTGTRQNRCTPSRWKSACSFTSRKM